MSRYTAEEKQARIAEARDLLRDLDSAAELRAASSSMAEAESERKDHLYRYGIALAKSDGLERRRREAEQLEATREREKKMTDAEQAKKWGQWVDRRIADALAEHTRATEEAVGQALAEERAEQRKRVREQIKIAVGELRTELVKQRGIAEGAIIDLPLFPVPRKRNAMPPDVLAARINLRVAELRLIAAETFVQLSRQPPRARGLLGNAPKVGDVADAPWRPSPSAWRFQPFGQAGGDGRLPRSDAR